MKRIHLHITRRSSWTVRSGGSAQIIPVVPPRDTSRHSPAIPPQTKVRKAAVMLRVLVTFVAACRQGTLRTAISAWINRPGTCLARIQPCMGILLEWVKRLPATIRWHAAPPLFLALPSGVPTRVHKNRRFALFRRRAVADQHRSPFALDSMGAASHPKPGSPHTAAVIRENDST